MSLSIYEPWRFFTPVSRPQSRAAGENGTELSDWIPSVDIRENEDSFVIHADVPGVDPDAIEITLDKGVLQIRGERKRESDVEEPGYRRSERVYGSFARRFNLPDVVDAEGISASSHNGVLEVTIPKQPQSKPRRVTVQH